MNHRTSCRVVTALLIVCGLSAAAQGQDARIDALIDGQVARLKSPADAAKTRSARKSLHDLAARSEGSPEFLLQLAKSINNKLLPLATDPDPRVRLNAAILAAQIGAQAQNAGFAPVTQAFLHDTTEAVSLWGLQSAKVVVPLLLSPSKATGETANVALAVSLGHDAVRAAMAHSGSEAVIEEAYQVAILHPTFAQGRSIDYANDIDKKALALFLPVTIELFESRVQQWDAGIPTEPGADWRCCKFFVKQNVWAAATPPQRAQITQLMDDLLKRAAKQLPNAGNQANDLLEVIQQTGVAFQILDRDRQQNRKLVP